MTSNKMAQSSNIEWTQATWNPVIGCTKVSAGCKNCYAERMAKRLAAMARGSEQLGMNAGRTANYLNVIDQNGRWNNEVFLDDTALLDPPTWRLPRVVFVNSMSDLFHDKVPTSFIRRIFDVMNDCPQHTFQVLTKRPERAAAIGRELRWTRNIWMGTSVEDVSVVKRISHLRQVPAKVRFLSVEPLLGPIPKLPLAGMHWVIVGGESGPGARPMNEEWVTQIRDRCLASTVPFFFKQWGGVNKAKAGRLLDGRIWGEMPLRVG